MTDAETAAAICSWVNDNMNGIYNLRQVNARFSDPAANYSANFLEILRNLIDEGKVPPYRN